LNLKYRIIGSFFRERSKNECHKVLETSNTYYKNLSEVNKKTFQIRTLVFLWTTNFSTEQGFLLTNKMKIIVSSAFVQITFGLTINTLKKFNSVFIAPRSYSYKNNKALFKGDVNLYTKKVNLSWPAVAHGFDVSDDAMNLTIHEFGHCLIFENASNTYLSKVFKDEAFENWKQQAIIKFQKIKLKQNKVLRPYAGTNLIELFSVSLEAFFEQPDFFEKHEPALYASMIKLLRQDPRRKLNPIEK
jgi:Mlc titration factor MtfA (ptsG expression regulator)